MEKHKHIHLLTHIYTHVQNDHSQFKSDPVSRQQSSKLQGLFFFLNKHAQERAESQITECQVELNKAQAP